MTIADDLLVEFDVRASPEHAFQVWTRRTSLWWPPSHTLSGDPESVVIEPVVGGLIVERAHDAREYVWGEVTHWDEPHSLGFLWHLFFDRSQATQVTLTFTPSDVGTRVRLEQSGFAALGDAGIQRRQGTEGAWAVVTEAFASCANCYA